MNRDFTIRDILWMIRRAIIPIAAIVIGVILVCALLLPSDGEAAVVYRTTADFQISADESSADPVASAIAVIPTYISVLESDGFSGRIADAAGISDSDAVTDSISFEQIVNTSVLRVSISADSPEQCIAIANACADVIATDAASIVGFGTVAPLGASDPAEHTTSAGLGKGTTIAIAALAALLCAAAVFIAIGIANPIIDIPEDAVLLYDTEALGIVDAKKSSASFERIAAKLRRECSSDACIWLVTDFGDGGGANTAASLAMASAASGRSILLADATLRAPKLDAALGIKAKDGLSDAAVKNKPVAVSRVNGYDYVGAGKSCDNPSAAIESIVSNDILRNLAAGYDTVIVLCENAVDYPDALTLSEDAAVTLLAAPLHKVSHAQFASVAADIGGKAKVIFTK